MRHITPAMNDGCCGKNEPYTNVTHACDGVQCPHHKPTPINPPQYPTGWVKENMLRIIDGFPYLMENCATKYGPFIKVSETVDTSITQRRDPSAIRLDATFDLTSSANSNSTLFNYFKQIVERKYSSLEGILPIIKKDIYFRLAYYITDPLGQTVHTAYATVGCGENWLNPTDIKDMFLTSFKNVMVVEIPDHISHGAGMYTITLDKIEVIVKTIDTITHLEDPDLNTFYSWTDNYQKIVLDHDQINTTEEDEMIVIASTNIMKSFYFDAAVTTRFKMNFVAYLSDSIITANTYEVWAALTQPTTEILDLLKTQVDTLMNQVSELQQLNDTLTVKVTNLETENTVLTEALEALDVRVTKLENPNDPTPPTPTPPSDGDEGGEDNPGTTTDPDDEGGEDTPTPTPPTDGEDEDGEHTDPTPTPGEGDDTDPTPTPGPGEDGEDTPIPPGGSEGDDEHTDPTPTPGSGDDEGGSSTPDPGETDPGEEEIP